MQRDNETEPLQEQDYSNSGHTVVFHYLLYEWFLLTLNLNVPHRNYSNFELNSKHITLNSSPKLNSCCVKSHFPPLVWLQSSEIPNKINKQIQSFNYKESLHKCEPNKIFCSQFGLEWKYIGILELIKQ